MTSLSRTLSRALTGALVCALLATPAYAASMKQAKKLMAANDIEGAVAELQPLARSGNAEANNMLGMLYMDGTGVAQDTAQATERCTLTLAVVRSPDVTAIRMPPFR